MSLDNTPEKINLTDLRQLRERCLKLEIENNMMIDARRDDAREYKQILEANRNIIEKVQARIPNWEKIFPEWI